MASPQIKKPEGDRAKAYLSINLREIKKAALWATFRLNAKTATYHKIYTSLLAVSTIDLTQLHNHHLTTHHRLQMGNSILISFGEWLTSFSGCFEYLYSDA